MSSFATATITPEFSSAVSSATGSLSVASSSPGPDNSYYLCPHTYQQSAVIGAVFGGMALGVIITLLIGLLIVWRQRRLAWKNACQCRSERPPTSDSVSRPTSVATLAEKTVGYTLEYGKALGYEKRLEYEKTAEFGRRSHGESDDGATLQGSVMH